MIRNRLLLHLLPKNNDDDDESVEEMQWHRKGDGTICNKTVALTTVTYEYDMQQK